MAHLSTGSIYLLRVNKVSNNGLLLEGMELTLPISVL